MYFGEGLLVGWRIVCCIVIEAGQDALRVMKFDLMRCSAGARGVLIV